MFKGKGEAVYKCGFPGCVYALQRLRIIYVSAFCFFLSGLLHHRLAPPGVHAQKVERAQQQAALRREAVQPRPEEGAQRAPGVGIPALPGHRRKGDSRPLDTLFPFAAYSY